MKTRKRLKRGKIKWWEEDRWKQPMRKHDERRQNPGKWDQTCQINEPQAFEPSPDDFNLSSDERRRRRHHEIEFFPWRSQTTPRSAVAKRYFCFCRGRRRNFSCCSALASTAARYTGTFSERGLGLMKQTTVALPLESFTDGMWDNWGRANAVYSSQSLHLKCF